MGAQEGVCHAGSVTVEVITEAVGAPREGGWEQASTGPGNHGSQRVLSQGKWA